MFHSVKDVARQLSMSERTVRSLADQYEWFGKPLGSEPGAPWVFTTEMVDTMRTTPRREPGRPRKPIGAEEPAVS